MNVTAEVKRMIWKNAAKWMIWKNAAEYHEELVHRCVGMSDLDPHEADVAALAIEVHTAMAEHARTKLAGEAVKETQKTIAQWAAETFGESGSNARVAARANEEMAELLRALTADDANPKAAAEVADIVIILYRLAERLGVDLMEEIDRKMTINRSRVWKRDNTGHGYHVRDKEQAK